MNASIAPGLRVSSDSAVTTGPGHWTTAKRPQPENLRRLDRALGRRAPLARALMGPEGSHRQKQTRLAPFIRIHDLDTRLLFEQCLHRSIQRLVRSCSSSPVSVLLVGLAHCDTCRTRARRNLHWAHGGECAIRRRASLTTPTNTSRSRSVVRTFVMHARNAAVSPIRTDEIHVRPDDTTSCTIASTYRAD